MKKIRVWVWLAVLAVGVWMLPFQSSDVAELVPLEVLVVTLEENQITLDGGTCIGRGFSWSEAVQDLRQGAPGEAFLGTIKYIVLCGDASELLLQAAWDSSLRPAAEICLCSPTPPDVERTAKLLSAHQSGVTLQQVRAMELRREEIHLPFLAQTEGGLRLHGA